MAMRTYDPGVFRAAVARAGSWLDQTGEHCEITLGDPWAADPRLLVGEGVLSAEEWESMDLTGEEDPEEYRQDQEILLTMAYERSDITQDPEYCRFLQEKGRRLAEYALFLALARFFGTDLWENWPEDIRRRYGYALDHYRRELYFDAEFQMYLQFLCHRRQAAI